MLKHKENELISLYISRSTVSTESNHTGSWRFVKPGYDEKTAPCSRACPAGEDIARIEMLAGQGMYLAAWETILRENPFPAICGRVCFHTCEDACNRAGLDDPVAIHQVERFIGDMAIREAYRVPHPFYGDEREMERRAERGKKIAIAGGGPAGLSAAYFLSRLGHQCDIFEADSEPGGVLRWGIPWYRLPEDVLKNEIARIIDMGVTIFCQQPLTREFIENGAENYDAVFMGCGYGRSMQMNIPGEELAQDGLRFLHEVRGYGANACTQGRVAVIGGGNTAVDVVRTLKRLGAKPILVYRRRKEDMPAFTHEIEMALEEGVKLMELLSPVRLDEADGNIRLTLQKMHVAKGMQTDTGRARVVPDGDKTEVIEVEQVYTAIGAGPAESWYTPPASNENVLELCHTTLLDDPMPVLFGGDLTTPVKSVTDAIASGKEAAMVFDTYFNKGKDKIQERLEACRVGNGDSLSMEIYLSGKRKDRNSQVVSFSDINTDYFPKENRAAPSVTPASERSLTFDEIEKTFDRETFLKEAARCFNCGICNDCDNCRLFCPEVAIYMDGTRCINFDYCKGCGVCVFECPRNAMSMEEEKI